MKAPEIIAEFARRTGLAEFKFNGHGVASLRIDGRLVIDLEHRPERGMLHLYAVMGLIPLTGREACFEALLAANLFGRDTDEAVFGLDVLRGEILLTRDVPLDGLDCTRFAKLLERFINTVDAWQEKLANLPATRVANKRPTTDWLMRV